MMRKYQISLLLLCLLFLAGCGGAPQTNDRTESAAPSSQEGVVDPQSDLSSQGDTAEMTPPSPLDPGLQGLIEKAKEDLAQRLNILTTQINLLNAKSVVWPDASIGCPQPGMQYKQVPYDGALIILLAENNTYEYHNGGTRGLFLCQKVSKEPNPPTQIDLLNLTPSKPNSSTPDNSIPPGEDQ